MQGKGNVAIGIDLGTTFSCIAVYKDNKIEIIPNELGDPTTPSIVTFSDDKIYSGEETLRIQTKDPKNTIYGIKRLIGRYFEDKEVQKEIKKYWTFKVMPGEQQLKGHLPLIEVDYQGKKQKFAPEQISSLILSKLKRSAERHLKTQVNSCVVTIPAHFHEEQRNATMKACNDAGFKVLGTLNEPEAAALAFGFQKINKNEDPEIEKNILVFDLGGGTFDVSILGVKNLNFTDKGKYGDPHFGGEDFDNALVDYCIDKFYEMKKIKIDKVNDPVPMKRLKMSCENAKKILSRNEKTQIELNDLKDNEDLSLEITRELFENICGHLFDKCISPIFDLLNEIGISAGGIDDIVLIGGSTKIPRIRQLIKNIFFQEPNTSINPDEAVAYGAAIMAAKLSGFEDKKIENILIKDITPYSLGIAVYDPDYSPTLMLLNFLSNLSKVDLKKGNKNKDAIFEINTNDALLMNSIIKKGSPIPNENTKLYHTLVDNQKEVEIEVYEGENGLVKDNTLLGKFRIKNLPPKKAGEVLFDVTFKIDSNSILTATAQLRDDKEKKSQLVVETLKGGISKNIINLVEKSGNIGIKDEKFKKMRKLKEEIDEYFSKIINPKKDEDDNLSDEEKDEIKFNLICNYYKAIEEFISLFDQKDLKNEAILDKIFEYLEKLFDSYKMALQIKSQVNKDFQEEVIKKVGNYFSNFFESKMFRLVDLLEKLNGIPTKIFFDTAVSLMQLFFVKGQMYKSDSKEENFNKYYAKIYFKASLDISEKYKLDKSKEIVDRKKKNQYEGIKNRCLSSINNLDAEYLIEVNKALSSNKLVSNELKNKKEKLHLLLDSLHQNISRLEGFDDKDSDKNISLCYANIVKIEFKLLENINNLNIIKDYANKCFEISNKEGNENFKKKSWFKEFEQIKKELDEKIKRKEEESDEEKIRIREKMTDTLKDISEKAKKMKECEFIKFIIDNYPPKGYKKEDDYVNKYKKNPEETLEKLTTAYHTSNYHGKDITFEKYLIIEQIQTELNKIQTKNKEPLNKINFI